MKRLAIWAFLAFLGAPALLMAQAPPPVDKYGELEVGVKLTADGLLATQVMQSKYWIGLSCEPIDDTLRSQLGLESNTGLVVRQVVDEGPAKAAGMQVHDVIAQVQIGEETHKPADIGQLTKLVQQAETKPMTFSLLRGGKPLSIAVTPAERKPDEAANVATARAVNGLLYQSVLTQNSLAPNPQANWARAYAVPFGHDPNTLAFRMAGPVLAWTQPPQSKLSLPDDVTVIIKKTGGQPAEMIIQQKDQGEWKVKEGEFAAPPEHVIQAVVSAVGSFAHLTIVGRVEDGKSMVMFQQRPEFTVPAYQATNTPYVTTVIADQIRSVAPVPAPVPQPSIEQRLDQLQQQHEELTKALNELKLSLEKMQPKE